VLKPWVFWWIAARAFRAAGQEHHPGLAHAERELARGEVRGQGELTPPAEFLGHGGELAFDQGHAVAAQVKTQRRLADGCEVPNGGRGLHRIAGLPAIANLDSESAMPLTAATRSRRTICAWLRNTTDTASLGWLFGWRISVVVPDSRGAPRL
jgi:hypothetical protein